MLRPVLAVAAGFVVLGAMAIGADSLVFYLFPHEFGPGGLVRSTQLLLFMLSYTLIAAAVGGYTTSRIAPASAKPCVFALALLVVAMTAVNLAVTDPAVPAWWKVALLILCGPSVWLGSWFRARTARL